MFIFSGGDSHLFKVVLLTVPDLDYVRDSSDVTIAPDGEALEDFMEQAYIKFKSEDCKDAIADFNRVLDCGLP